VSAYAEVLGVALISLGALGVGFKSVEFVRVTIPTNYGSNPGFGAYETMVLPYWAFGSVGLGLMTSWEVGIGCFIVGLLTLGLVAQLLGRVFRG
jgi:hypothetical protein